MLTPWIGFHTRKAFDEKKEQHTRQNYKWATIVDLGKAKVNSVNQFQYVVKEELDQCRLVYQSKQGQTNTLSGGTPNDAGKTAFARIDLETHIHCIFLLVSW
jgi:hypothetical protein